MRWVGRATVHPRGRGERDPNSSRAWSAAGSSPRARGTQQWHATATAGRRFIPAGAGNARWRNVRSSSGSVHPRGRGERFGTYQKKYFQYGSSPRARGTPWGARDGRCAGRFIPAGAGNAIVGAVDRPEHRVHPRGRGERGGYCVPDEPLGGSSPRARGTRVAFDVEHCRRRFIPAGAGNAAGCGCRRRRRPVHPRGRGERVVGHPKTNSPAGSSPRARGTHADGGGRAADLRFIPAGAGNAPSPMTRAT